MLKPLTFRSFWVSIAIAGRVYQHTSWLKSIQKQLTSKSIIWHQGLHTWDLWLCVGTTSTHMQTQHLFPHANWGLPMCTVWVYTAFQLRHWEHESNHRLFQAAVAISLRKVLSGFPFAGCHPLTPAKNTQDDIAHAIVAPKTRAWWIIVGSP